MAIADDINALYWNPAGLPGINQLGINSMYADLFKSGVKNGYLSFCIPGPDRVGIGVDLLSIGFDDDELKFVRNKINFSIGYQLPDWASLGLNVKYVSMTAELDRISQGTFSGIGFDYGMLFQPSKKWKIGFMVHDLSNTQLSGLQGNTYQRNARIGTSYQFSNAFLLAADFDDRIHLGTEWYPFRKIVALRAGFQKDIYTKESPTYSIGFGLELPFRNYVLQFDYAYIDSPTLFNSSRSSVMFLIDLFPELLRIDKIILNPIFASLYKHHSRTPIGKVVVEYKGDTELDCQVKVNVAKYGREILRNTILAPMKFKKKQEIYLFSDFLDSILTEYDNIPLTANVAISYPSKYRKKVARKSEIFTLYKINYLDWNNGVEQAAAFVTHKDPAVTRFVRFLLSDKNLKEGKKFINNRCTLAFQLFNGISRYGVQYDQDTFPVEGLTERGLDEIKYPVQILHPDELRGDCEDLTVFLASVFENRNIPTAFIDLGNHITLMFNTGEHIQRADLLPYPEELFYPYQKTLWIPLEATYLDRSFLEAWKYGRQEIVEIDDTERQIIEIRRAWQKYQPVNYVSRFLSVPLPGYQQDLGSQQNNLAQLMKNHIQQLEEYVKKYPDSTEIRNILAIKYFFANQPENSEKQLRIILSIDRDNFSALNNLGNIFASKGELDSAQFYYNGALANSQNPEHRNGVTLNMALLEEAVGNDSVAVNMFIDVMQTPDNFEKIENLLGIVLDEEETGKADKKPKLSVSKSKTKLLIKKANKKLKSKDRKPKRKKFKSSGRKGKLPQGQIENIFYWAR